MFVGEIEVMVGFDFRMWVGFTFVLILEMGLYCV